MMKLFMLLALLTFSGLAAGNPLNEKGFIADWLVAGPFPSYEGERTDSGLETDFLDGEAAVRPYPGQSREVVFKADESKLILGAELTNEWGFREDLKLTAEWRSMHFANPERILADDFFPPIRDRFAFYAACYIESPAEREIKVRLGSDDDHKIYLNGALLGKSATSQAVKPDTFLYRAKLKPGLNFLLLKVVDRLFDCGFCVALSDAADQPLTGIRIHTDSPARKLGADNYLNGFGVKITFPEETLFDDRKKQDCRLTLFAPDSGTYDVEFGGEGRPMKTKEEALLQLALPAGTHELGVIIRERGKELARIPYPVTVHSRRALERKLRNLRAEAEKLKLELPELDRRIGEQKLRVEEAKKRVAAAVTTVEERYAKMRTDAQAAALPSLGEPFPAETARTRILLNGVWKAGLRGDRLDRSFRLPHGMTGNYYRRRYYPVEAIGSPHAAEYKMLAGYEKHDLKELLEIFTARRVFFEREITIDDLSGSWYFICTGIVGEAKIYCNGELAGSYHGMVGLLEVPLPAIRKGRNLLRIEFTRSPMITDPNGKFYGILGDLLIEQRSPVHVADVWVKPSWRNASLSLSTELFNGGETTKEFRLEQYAVREGKIRFRLPIVEGKLEPGKTAVFENSGKWRDPKLWDIAHPALYELVSDLYIDGRLADRKSDRFGFREFWIHGVDFFLNGKRVILQGDVGVNVFQYEKCRDVIFPLLRADGINLLRLHDSSCHMLGEVADAADRYGMYLMAQAYPQGDFSRKADSALVKEFKSLEEWKKSPWHDLNRENFRRWHRLMRNHPSILIWSVDNELFTPGCESRGLEKRNELVDDIVDAYYTQMRELDPELVVTRDGDVCTYGPDRRNHRSESPANIHYPEFHPDRFVTDWQRLFQYRPAIYGETLYCSYVWGGWPGATPKMVAQKSAMVRKTAARFRELGIPAPVYMGVGLDGFVELKADGSGSPWGVTEVPRYKKRPENWRNGMPEDHYPFIPIPWPAESGRGMRPEYLTNELIGWGFRGINCFRTEYPLCVRNAVNEAYRETLIPQPPIADPGIAEAIIVAEPESIVFTTLPGGGRYGILADGSGKAYFHLDAPGKYRFESNGMSREAELKSKHGFAAKPGFDDIPVIHLKE